MLNNNNDDNNNKKKRNELINTLTFEGMLQLCYTTSLQELLTHI